MAWLLLPASALPRDDAWLAPEECRVLETLRFARRRGDWRLGRWTAKRALLASTLAAADPAQIAILADADGVPRVFHRGAPARCAISISHRAGSALCVTSAARAGLGCDLEVVEPRSDAFIADYFTQAERLWLGSAVEPERAQLANLLWSAKESAVKALGTGWRIDARSVEVAPGSGAAPEGWRSLRVRCRERAVSLRAWWRREGELLLTVALPAELGPDRILARLPDAAAGPALRADG